MLSKTYTVNYSGLEGGNWLLQSAFGTTYLPTNMPLELRQAGLKVKCRLIKEKNVSSIYMTADLVRIISYKVLNRH